MAAYQIPQFLDSGDKIIGPLNLRQFGYALGGFMFCVVVFTLTSNLSPQLGVYAVIPAIPFALFFAYLSLGKYNGRDADVYIYKFFLYTIRAKQMTYQRAPYFNDLEKKATEWTSQAIAKRWLEESEDVKVVSENDYATFKDEESMGKAAKVRRLAKSIDANLTNTLGDVSEQNIRIATEENLIRQKQIRMGKKVRPLPNQGKNGYYSPVMPMKSRVKEDTDNYFTPKPPQN